MAATWSPDPQTRRTRQQPVKEGSLNGGVDKREMRLLVPIASNSHEPRAQAEYILLRGDSWTQRAKGLSRVCKSEQSHFHQGHDTPES